MLFQILGPLEVHTTIAGKLGAGKPAAVLAALLLRPNAWVGVDQLIGAAWPGRPVPASAEANLKTYVWQLRRMLPGAAGGARIERCADAYRIRVGPGELDADRAADLAVAARKADCDSEALPLLEEALRLWRGTPVEGLEVDPAALARLTDLHLDLRTHLGEVQLALGHGQEAAATLRSVTADAPLREGAWTLLVRALHAGGMRTEALLAYREAAGVLRADLGVEPGPELAAEGRRLLREGPRRELPRPVHLVGRGAELRRLLRPAPVTIVDGMPGVGKTALVVEAAHQLAAGFPDGQLFVAMTGRVPVTQRLLRGIGVTDLPDDPEEQAALWRSEVARRELLIVLDGARDSAGIGPLLPATTGSRTLITTTHRGWHLAGAARISLRPLGDVDAAVLFDSAAGPRGVDRRAVAAVLAGCGGLPAALLDAAARLRSRPHWTMGRLAEEIGGDPGRVFSAAVRGSIDAALTGLSPAEQAVWRSLGAAPAEITAPAAARAAHESLVDRGLLESAGPDRYRSHVVFRKLAAS